MPGQSIELKSQFSRILFQAVLCHRPRPVFLILFYYRHLRLEGKYMCMLQEESSFVMSPAVFI